MMRNALLRPLSFALAAVALAFAGSAAAQDKSGPAATNAPSQAARPDPATTTYRFDYRLPQPVEIEEENTRAVRIIDEGAFPASPPPPIAAAPADAPPPNYEMANVELKAENSAGLAVQILPGPELQVGNRIAFKVSTKRTGYLLLVDVDAAGKLTQIFPNQRSLMAERGRENTNRIRSGQTVTIPDAKNAMAGFEFVAAPPNGVAMVVAILSERPVQLIDLPDVPPQFAGREEALKYLTDFARTLKIAGNEEGVLQDTKWSFDAKFYAIR